MKTRVNIYPYECDLNDAFFFSVSIVDIVGGNTFMNNFIRFCFCQTMWYFEWARADCL